MLEVTEKAFEQVLQNSKWALGGEDILHFLLEMYTVEVSTEGWNVICVCTM